MLSSPSTPSSICIIGPGAVGTFLAAWLSNSHKVWLVGKSQEVQTLQEEKISISGDIKLSCPTNKITSIVREELFLLPNNIHFWLCVKAYDLDSVLEHLLPYLDESTPLIILSNGLGVFFEAAQKVKRKAPYVRLLLNFGLQKTAPFEVLVRGAPSFSLSTLPEDNSWGEQIKNLLESKNATVTIERNIALAEWKKTLINLLVNPICSILNLPNSAIYENALLRPLIENILTEIKSVAKRDGFDFSYIDTNTVFDLIKPHGQNINSSLMDLKQGKKSEMDYLLGRFLRMARDYGVETPRCGLLYGLYMVMEEQAQVYSLQ